MKLIPKYKRGNQVKFKYRLGYDPELNTVRTAFVNIPEVVITPNANDYRRLALNRSRRATSPTISFDNAIDLDGLSRLVNQYWNGRTCLNTVTSFYGLQYTGAVNREFVVNPEKYGFTQIPQNQALPGDIIILSNKSNYPHHAVMFDSVAAKDSVSPQGGPIEEGDTLVNYSNGSLVQGKGYRKQNPLSMFLEPNAGGDFTGVHRYFRFTGKKK